MSIGGIDNQLRNTQDSITSGTRKPLDSRLLDVLALQRIKERQAAAKRELQASMPQEKRTIADQLTNEVINNEKEKLQGGIKDIAAQVGGVNNQQAAQQQQNMQRVAQQGVATQPAPNMARMAGGGIVAFAGPNGSLVNAQNLTEEQIQFLRSQGLNDAQIASITPDKLPAIMIDAVNKKNAASKYPRGSMPEPKSGATPPKGFRYNPFEYPGELGSPEGPGLLDRIRKDVDFGVTSRRPAGYGMGNLDYAPELKGVPEGYEEKIRKRNELQANNPIRKNIATQRREFTASRQGAATRPTAAEDIGPLSAGDLRGDEAAKRAAEAAKIKADAQAFSRVPSWGDPQNRFPSYYPASLPNAQPGAQPGAQQSVAPPAEPNAGIQTAIPKTTGQISGTSPMGYTDEYGLTGGSKVQYRPQPGIIGVTQKQDELREYLKGIRGQDVGAAREAQLTRADEHMNRAGIANQYRDMLARRREANRVSKEERDYWALNDMLARAGGQGALSNIARGAADMRATERRRASGELAELEALERAGITEDRTIAGRTLESGDKAAKLTSDEKRAAATAESSLLANQANVLTEEAKAMLQGDMANLTAESKAFDRRLSLMTANASNEVKVAVANLNGKLKSEANEIAKMAISAKNVSDFNVVLARINEAMGKIRAGVADDLTKVTTSNPIYLAMQQDDPKKAAEYLKTMQSTYQEIADDAVRELTAQRTLVTASLTRFKRPSK